MANVLIVLRGISGCGKSTFTDTLPDPKVICSADHYFIDRRTGLYQYNEDKIGEAHKSCFRKALGAVQDSCPFVVVDNTNCSLMECSPYVLMGEALGYDVEVITVEPPSTMVAAARNNHWVPTSVVEAMAQTLAGEPSPSWWCARTVRMG